MMERRCGGHGRGRIGALLPVLLLAACAGTIDEGQQIQELVAPKDETPAPVLPLEPTERVGPNAELALQNYEKLLDLPQDPVSRAETMRRLADLQLELDEAGGSTFEQSEQRLRRSITLYTAVLAEQPGAPNNDRVLYQLARAHQNLGEADKAEDVLERMIREYPSSSYAGDAHFRRAELLFKLGEFAGAQAEYEQVLALKDATPFFQAAQYKHGWALYRQSKYEEAIGVFLTILDRELPPGEHTDLAAALEGVRPGKKDMVKDAVRVVSLSFALLGGPDAAGRYFSTHGAKPYGAVLYAALGEQLLEKKRYTDSAQTYFAFINAHPRHELAPVFLARAIGALDLGTFTDQVVEAKERYARHLDPAAPYWSGRSPAPEVLKDLRSHLEELARHYQARGQKVRADGTARAASDFQAAARHYRRLLELYPQDPETAELRFLLAEALSDAGDVAAAAEQYNKVVADHPRYERAPEAAYAALLAAQRRSAEVPDAERPAALRESVKAGLALAERFPQHPQALAALTRAAEDLYRLREWDEVLAVAGRVLKANPPAPEDLRRTAWTVSADAQFSRKRYAEAEQAYLEVLSLTPATAAEREPVRERLASSIYKQGEAARDAGNPRAAAEAFLRVGRRVADAGIRATADYDAGAMLIAAKDWAQAAAVLEAFRAAHPSSALLPEVDKKLAVVYQNSNRPKDAATVLGRIAARTAESTDNRRDAAWLAVALMDQARDPKTIAAYESYLQQYPQPFDRAMEARARLAELAKARGEDGRQAHWLREMVAADAKAGAARTPRSRQLAAQAALELGRTEARQAVRIPLKLPLAQSVSTKKQATERAVELLAQAADYGVAEVTTAATFELGVLYQEFSKALLASDRPRKLSALEREQYDLLLEEQAFPLEEKAIQFHESNLQRVMQGVYTPWIGRSLQALSQLAPGRYGKREQTAEVYDELR